MTILLTVLTALFPYLQNPQPTQMTVMWPSTNLKQTAWVEYGEQELDHVTRESHYGLYMAYSDINRVTLTQLKPATTYRYRVVALNIVGKVHRNSLTYGDTIYSPVYQFTTPPLHPTNWSCVICNDIHDNHSFLGEVLAKNNIDPLQQDFFFFNGDLMHCIPSREDLIDRVLMPYSQLFASRVPFLYTRGNHELRHQYARELERFVTTPGSAEQHPFYYSFTYGSCYFVVLDAGEDKPDTAKSYCGLADFDAYREQEALWLKQQLQSRECRKAAFRIVLMHVPFESNTTQDYALGEINRLFLPLLNQHKFDLAICGHTHHAALLPANNQHHFPILIGGGKDLRPERRDFCPAVVQLKATPKQIDVRLWNYYSENPISYTIKK